MLQYKRPSNQKMNNALDIGKLLLLVVILPMGVGYIGTSPFGLPVWSSILLGLASSLVIFLGLVILLGTNVRFPDHLPGYEDDLEV